MIDTADFIVLKNYKKKYRYHCDTCGADRGYCYKDKTSVNCYVCAIQIRNLKQGFTTPKDIPFIIKDSNKLYKAPCRQCSKDRGYVRKNSINELCASCAAKNRNVLKPKNAELDAHRRIRRNMKGNIGRKLHLRQSSKAGNSVKDILPYSIKELADHLESKFQPGMTWDNYGLNGWEIDHRVPDSWYNYSSCTDIGFQNSWALSNLQPLWASENRLKSNKFIS